MTVVCMAMHTMTEKSGKQVGTEIKKAAITNPMEDKLMNVTGGTNPFDSKDTIVPTPNNPFVLDDKNDLDPLIRILE